MKNKIINYKIEIASVLFGSIGGWLYWHFVGCSSGSCAITSNPINSSLYGAALGWLLTGILKKEQKKL